MNPLGTRRDDRGVWEAVGDATWHKKQEHYR